MPNRVDTLAQIAALEAQIATLKQQLAVPPTTGFPIIDPPLFSPTPANLRYVDSLQFQALNEAGLQPKDLEIDEATRQAYIGYIQHPETLPHPSHENPLAVDPTPVSCFAALLIDEWARQASPAKTPIFSMPSAYLGGKMASDFAAGGAI